jgi:hypothetical protein
LTAFFIVTIGDTNERTNTNVKDIVGTHMQQRQKLRHSIFAIRLLNDMQMEKTQISKFTARLGLAHTKITSVAHLIIHYVVSAYIHAAPILELEHIFPC